MSVKKEKSPGLFGLYFYASLMVLFGALLGFAYLLTFPSQAFSSQKEYAASVASGNEEAQPRVKPGDAYFLEGPILNTRSWEAKRQQLVAEEPQTVSLSPGELNAWMSAKFRPGLPPTGGDEPNVLIVPGVPNVALTETGTMYLNLPTRITAYGSTNNFTVSARCVFDGAKLKFKTIQVSSARVPLPNLLGAQLLETLAQGYQATEEYAILSGALSRAESIEVQGDQLVFKLR